MLASLWRLLLNPLAGHRPPGAVPAAASADALAGFLQMRTPALCLACSGHQDFDGVVFMFMIYCGCTVVACCYCWWCCWNSCWLSDARVLPLSCCADISLQSDSLRKADRND